MPKLEIAAGESLHYEYETPGATGRTFVFVNALTGSIGTWQHPESGPVLRRAGHLIPIERPRAFAQALLHFARTLQS